MSSHHITRAPGAIRNASLDNLALVPASMLPYKEQWQRIANELPQGSTLIILPSLTNKQRKNCEKVAQQLREAGHQVMTLPAEEVTKARTQEVSPPPVNIQQRLL